MRRRRFDNDEGASLILITVSMLLLVGMAAIAVDLGVVRADLRSSQLVADVDVALATSGVGAHSSWPTQR